MKKFFLLFIALCQLQLAFCQLAGYWQQQVNYAINVTLNDKDHTLDGFEKVTYFNHSPDTLTYIWFHLWPNAYKNDKTAFSDQLLRNGNTKFYFSTKEQRGYINRLDFKVNDLPAKTEDHPQYIDVVKVVLPAPLPPSGQITITTPFHVKLPYNFSRGGHDKKSYQITQWYPKPAVYDAQGWHPMPYLDQGEFYSEYGNFDVQITVPQPYVVAATGQLQNAEEKEWMLHKKVETVINTQQKNLPKPSSGITNNKKAPVKKQASNVKKTPAVTPKVTPASPAEVVTKTLHFTQDNVHDFAWFANKNFIVNYDTCQLLPGKTIDVFTYYTPGQQEYWKNSLQYCKEAVRFYSQEVGLYPYATLSAVQGPKSFGGGMEYPTITVISPIPSAKELDMVIAHEIGHNWFYGIIGSNERDHPWMDEGINSFYEYKYSQQKYGHRADLQELLLESKETIKTDQPIETPASGFSPFNYALVVYHKTAKWLQWVEQNMGADNFRKQMHQYFEDWKFKHPQPQDFKNALQPVLGQQTDSLFHLLTVKGKLPAWEKQKNWKVATPFYPSSFKNYMQQPSRNLLIFSPIAGYNKYDKFIAGVLFTNYTLPPSPFQFVAAPMFATHSKKLVGLGRMGYTFYPAHRWQQIQIGVSGMKFSKNESLDTNGRNLFEEFYRITPSVRLTMKENILSSRKRALEAKTFFIGERNFSNRVQKSTDNLTIFADSIKLSHRYINQLTFSETNTRALYPYDYQVQVQQGKSFYRINFTSHYFFNYADGGGLNVRLFAAKFGFIGEDKFSKLSSAIYQPKLLGVTGEEDFTYSNYFLGRTASFRNSDQDAILNKGLAARQIMIRDGGLKLRIDQYEFVQGRSENWVTAANFNTTLPKDLFPIPLPLKLFLDVGTYAEAWKSKANVDRFLYVGGFQLSLAKNLVNIYVPLVYSKVFKDYLQSLPEQNSLFKRMTFSIDIDRINFRHLLDRKIAF